MIAPTFLISQTLTGLGRTEGVNFKGTASLSIAGGVGTVQVQRSFDDGASWETIDKDNDGNKAEYVLNNSGISLLIENEDPSALYAVNVSAYTSGNFPIRLSR